MMTNDFMIQGDMITQRYVCSTQFLEHVENVFRDWNEVIRLEIVQLSVWFEILDVHFALHSFRLKDVCNARHVLQSGYGNQISCVLRQQSVRL